MENSKIEWTDHTFNPWTGCQPVSPGCAHCYAAAWAKRAGRDFATRIKTKTWGDPFKWNKAAAESGTRPRVFCASLADWLDDQVPIEWLSDLICLIEKTRNLDWLLLTKRPENWASRMGEVAARDDMGAFLAKAWGAGRIPPNIWLGITAENQDMASKRIPTLIETPARVRFLSCEPLLGPINLSYACTGASHAYQSYSLRDLDWVIVGGESGPSAREMETEWVKSIMSQCDHAEVPFLFKQWGGTNKKVTGRRLMGRTWDGFPVVNAKAMP